MDIVVPEKRFAKDYGSPFLYFFFEKLGYICSHNQSLNSVIITRSSEVGKQPKPYKMFNNA